MSGEQLWFIIEQVVTETEAACGAALIQEKQFLRLQGEAALLPGGKYIDGGSEGADIVKLRSLIRSRLGWLKQQLSMELTEREVYYCLFPLTIHFDEMVHQYLSDKTRIWSPLQKELFNIDNGGEIFFTTADELLKRAQTLPLVFEVFYFCLRNGFKGAFINTESRLKDYLARLEARIPLPNFTPVTADAMDDQGVELLDFPWRYYVFGLGAVLGVYCLLFLVGYIDFSTSF
jgi:type VI protein secretion system component VasF